MKQDINILIPMAGAGKRFVEFGYKLPKPLIDVDGKPMICAVLDSLCLDGQHIFIVREYEDEEHNEELYSVLVTAVENPRIISTPKITRGAAETCLKAKKLIDSDAPLVITNCDQIFNWNAGEFLKFAEESGADGVVAVFESADTRYSYIQIDDSGAGIELAEKNPISNLALTGFHYWKHGSDFVRSSSAMIAAHDTHKGEFYVAPSYNYLIKEGKKILPFLTKKEETTIIGTPEQLELFLKKLDGYESF